MNGLAYLEVGTFSEDKGTPDPTDDRVLVFNEDLPLIEWLRENVEGSPVIVEAAGPLYHWASRISWNTGLPAVIGWDWHQVQQRQAYDYLVQSRRAETARFYTDVSPSLATQYLRKYNVRYVVVGTTEFTFGTEAGLAKFDYMPELVAVYRSGRYVIYEVKAE